MSRMTEFLQAPKGLRTSKFLFDKAKYANYLADELRMDFYLKIMKTLMSGGDSICKLFGGSKRIYVAMVSMVHRWCLVWVN